MFQTIVFATDGSDAAARASEYVAALAKCYDAQVLALHVVASPPTALSEPHFSQAVRLGLEHGHTLVAATERRLRELGVAKVETSVLEGHPVEAILHTVATHSPHLLVIGARGMSPWKGLVLGSVSLALTQRAECPVLVVK
jgi:nucleotide-binding universal stress UspA family protein